MLGFPQRAIYFRNCLGVDPVDRSYHASELETLQAIEQHGDLNPIQNNRLKELRAAGSAGSQFGIESAPGTNLGASRSVNAGAGGQAITDALTKQTTDFNAIKTQGQNDVTGFLTKYGADVPATYNSTYAKYNIPGQVSYVDALRSRIADLSGNQSNAGAGGFSSAGQVDAAVNSRYLPLFETGVSNLNTSAGLANTEATNLLAPDVKAGELLNDRLAREMTGFTTTQQTTLGGLIAKLNAGVSLDNTSLTLANNLALKLQDYNNNLGILKQQQAVTTVPATSSIYNAGTGKFTTTPTTPLPGGTGGTGGNSTKSNAALYQELGLLS